MATVDGKKTGGRKKGTPNKVTKEVKSAMLAAFDKVGGVDYLVRQAEDNPQAFLTLLGKIIPSEMKATVSGDPDAPLITRVELVPLNEK